MRLQPVRACERRHPLATSLLERKRRLAARHVLVQAGGHAGPFEPIEREQELDAAVVRAVEVLEMKEVHEFAKPREEFEEVRVALEHVLKRTATRAFIVATDALKCEVHPVGDLRRVPRAWLIVGRFADRTGQIIALATVYGGFSNRFISAGPSPAIASAKALGRTATPVSVALASMLVVP